MRPVLKGTCPKDEFGNDIQVTQYARARRYLIDRIGEYCSYCERKIEASLAVEHVQPKASNPSLALVWDNFLLACTNCNSTKGSKVVQLEDFVWPDSDDTFRFFTYDGSGVVNINKSANQILKDKIQNMINLVGLQKKPPRVGSPDWEKASDRRFEHRIQAWSEATHYMNSYRRASQEIRMMMLPLITTIVVHQGFWSIWMNVFKGFPEVQLELILGVDGTNTAFFPELIVS